MRRAWLSLLALPLLALAACTGGVKSTGDVSGDLTEVYPLTEGHYLMVGIGSDAGADLVRDAGGGYRFDDPAKGEGSEFFHFHVFAMPELPATNFLIQVVEKKPDEPTAYTYYFLIASDDQMAVLSPSRYELINLPEALAKLAATEDTDELAVTDAANTLEVLQLIASKGLKLELFAQFVRQP